MIGLHNIAFITDYNLNLIFFSQVYKNSIIYYNKSTKITLKKEETIIVYIKQECNLFFLNLTILRAIIAIKNLKFKAMAINNKKWPTYLVSKNKCIKIWY